MLRFKVSHGHIKIRVKGCLSISGVISALDDFNCGGSSLLQKNGHVEKSGWCTKLTLQWL